VVAIVSWCSQMVVLVNDGIRMLCVLRQFSLRLSTVTKQSPSTERSCEAMAQCVFAAGLVAYVVDKGGLGEKDDRLIGCLIISSP
jgi:hypothetical protein